MKLLGFSYGICSSLWFSQTFATAYGVHASKIVARLVRCRHGEAPTLHSVRRIARDLSCWMRSRNRSRT